MRGLDPDTNNNNNNYNPHKEDGIVSGISISERSDARQVRRVKGREGKDWVITSLLWDWQPRTMCRLMLLRWARLVAYIMSGFNLQPLKVQEGLAGMPRIYSIAALWSHYILHLKDLIHGEVLV